MQQGKRPRLGRFAPLSGFPALVFVFILIYVKFELRFVKLIKYILALLGTLKQRYLNHGHQTNQQTFGVVGEKKFGHQILART